MSRSIVTRARNAARRWRLRFVYERIRPELSMVDVVSRADVAPSLTQAGQPFSRLLEAYLERAPRTLWEHAPSATPNEIDRARRGEWSLLGKTLAVSPATDWHRDPIFGARWSPRYVEALSYYRPSGDVVTLWHLNKMMFLLDLAAAYQATRDPNLAERIYDTIDSWCVANPYLVGINWVSPLDIATRVAVWSQALAAIAEAPLPSEEKAARILRSMLRQADHVASHLSEWPIPNNHLLGEVALLYTFAAYAPVWKDTTAWMARAESVIVSEVQRQVLKDGFQYEASVNYHAYALDFVLMYLHSKALRHEAPHPIVLSKARAMAIAHMELVFPSGRQPRIGDDTIDRFFVLAYALDGPPLHGDECEFTQFVRPVYARVFAATPWGSELLGTRVPTRHARHFTEAGISVARDHDAAVVFVHGPQHHQPFSHGHLHADAGSFELEIGGVPLVVDAGTYVYFADAGARTYFKSARAHNAPVVDDVEPMRSLEPFRWENVATAEHLGFGAAPIAIGVGTRRKFSGAEGVALEHTRALVVSKGTALVFDAIRDRDESPVAPRTHLARICFRTPTPSGTAFADGTRVRVTDPRRFVRVVEAFGSGPTHVDSVDDPDDRDCWYSSRYGELRRGVAVRVSAELETRVVVLSVFRNTDVGVIPIRLDADESLAAIESHGERCLVRVHFDPFSIVVGGRVIAGRGADTVPFATPRSSSPRTSSTPEWLDELSMGS